MRPQTLNPKPETLNPELKHEASNRWPVLDEEVSHMDDLPN